MTSALLLLAAGACGGDDEPDAAPGPTPTASPTASPTAPGSGDPTGAPTGGPTASLGPDGLGTPAVPTPSTFVASGIDCGLLDLPALGVDEDGLAEQDRVFAAADSCIANALRTGQAASFRLVSGAGAEDVVFAVFTVEGPGELRAVEDHRTVVVSDIDERVRTCTEARSLTLQGNCETRDVVRR